MNERQITVQKQFLKNEKDVIKQLEIEYKKALKQINDQIKILQASEETQSKIYQIEYQVSLKLQIEGILDKLKNSNYETIQNYLNDCYVEGFVGAMYDLQGQGIPMAFPIDQSQVTKAVKLESKISKGLYKNMSMSIDNIQKKISDVIATGLASGQSFEEISKKLELATGIDYNRCLRIIRTEGHRIQNKSSLDLMNKAKDCGAQIVKQWDATLDDKTRETHAELDGQVVDIDEPFTIPSTGAQAMLPGGFNDPSEDCNCRCAVLQRASFSLDDFNATKMDNLSGELVEFKEKDYQDFKDEYFSSFN